MPPLIIHPQIHNLLFGLAPQTHSHHIPNIEAVVVVLDVDVVADEGQLELDGEVHEEN